MNFEELLKFAVDQGASDVHFQSGSAPQVRIGGLIRNVESPAIDVTALRQFAGSIAPQAIAEDMNGAMFRGARFSVASTDWAGSGAACTASAAMRDWSCTLWRPRWPRSTSSTCRPCSRGCPDRRAITIMTGPSGSGKSTTLAAIVDHLNESLHGKIVTIEDPIEVLHSHKKAFIAQREIGTDVASMADGIEQAIVQDADVIVAGDPRRHHGAGGPPRCGDRPSGLRDHVQSQCEPGARTCDRNSSDR